MLFMGQVQGRIPKDSALESQGLNSGQHFGPSGAKSNIHFHRAALEIFGSICDVGLIGFSPEGQVLKNNTNLSRLRWT